MLNTADLTPDDIALAKTRIQEIDLAAAKELFDQNNSPIFIDVRLDAEWQQGHIKTAHHLCLDTLEEQIVQQFPEKNTAIILYCTSGNRSAVAADCLQHLGYTNTRSLIGGFRGWHSAGFPVEL